MSQNSNIVSPTTFYKIAIFIAGFIFFYLNVQSQTPADSLNRADNPSKKTAGKSVIGVASFYSRSLDGSETATGEIFRQNGNTAASNFFKLNTWVRVTNLRNGNTAIVRINDRMHVSMSQRGRVIDVSRSIAKKLDFLYRGLTRVQVEVVPKGTVE